MRLYPKKLRSVDDLQREKKILLQKQRELEQEDILSLDNILGTNGKEGLMPDLLFMSQPLVNMGIQMAKNWFSKEAGVQRVEELMTITKRRVTALLKP